MKNMSSTLKLFSVAVAMLLFCTFASAQSRGGDPEDVPHVDIEVDAAQTVVETGIKYVFSYPVRVEAPSWIAFDEGASDDKEVVCLKVEENHSTSSREATVLIKHYESLQVIAVVHVVQSGR